MKETNEKNVDEKIEPHEIYSGVEKKKDISTLPHVKSPEEVEREELEKNIEIDLSKIEKDEEGIPVIKNEDIRILEKTNIVDKSYRVAIELAKELIKDSKEKLSDEFQEDTEKSLLEYIDQLNEKLNSLVNEEEKNKIKKDIEETKEAINSLPKYNETVKNELNTTIKDSINLLAMYQNVARKEINDLKKDGSLLALINQMSYNNFVKYYIDIYIKFYKNLSLDNNKDVSDIVLSSEVDLLNDTIINDIDIDDITSNLKINKNDVNPKVIKDIYIRITDLKLKLNSLKDVCKPEFTYKELKDYLIFRFKESLKLFSEIKIEDNNTNLTVSRYVEEIKEIKNIYNEIEESGDSILDEKFEDFYKIIDKCYNIIIIDYEDIYFNLGNYEKMYKTFVHSFKNKNFLDILYSLMIMNVNNLNHFATPKNIFNPEYIINISEFINEVTRNLISANVSYKYDRNTEEYKNEYIKEFEISKFNINISAINFSYFIKYINILNNNKTDEVAEWVKSFDPNKYIETTYLENKEEINKYFNYFSSIINDFVDNILLNNLDNEVFITDFCEKCVLTMHKLINKKTKRIYDEINVGLKISILKLVIDIYTENNKLFGDHRDPRSFASRDEREKIKNDNIDSYNNLKGKIIEFILFLGVGGNLISTYHDMYNKFIEYNCKNENEEENMSITTIRDNIKYLFHEMQLNMIAMKECKDEEKVSEFIKRYNNNTIYNSINFEFEKNKSGKDIRKENIIKILKLCIYTVLNIKSSFEFQISRLYKTMVEATAENNKNINKKYEKELEKEKYMKMRKSFKKIKNIRKYNNRVYEDLNRKYKLYTEENNRKYSSINSEAVGKDRYYLEVIPNKEKSVFVKVLYMRGIERGVSKDIFNVNILNKNKDDKSTFDIDKEFNNSFNINVSDRRIRQLGEKKYFNSILDKSIIDVPEDLKNSKSTFIKKAIYESFIRSEEYIKEFIINKLIKTGAYLDENKNISILFKDNCRLNIKYYEPDDRDTGTNLNFFKDNKWVLTIYELNYDVLNEK